MLQISAQNGQFRNATIGDFKVAALWSMPIIIILIIIEIVFIFRSKAIHTNHNPDFW